MSEEYSIKTYKPAKKKQKMIEYRNEKEFFYVGTKKFYVERKQNSILNDLDNYFSFVYGQISGTLLHFQKSNNFDFEYIKSIVPNVIISTFFSILEYNNFFINIPTSVIITNKNMCLGEPLFFNLCNKKQLKIYVSENLINLFLDQNKISAYNITFDSKLNNEKFEEYEDFDCCNLLDTKQPYIHKIFTLADHLATHFLDVINSGKTDWIHHREFGKGGGTTLNSILNIELLLKNVSLFSSLKFAQTTQDISLISSNQQQKTLDLKNLPLFSNFNPSFCRSSIL